MTTDYGHERVKPATATRRRILVGGGAAIAATAMGGMFAGSAHAQAAQLVFGTSYGLDRLKPFLPLLDTWNAEHPDIQVTNTDTPWTQFWQNLQAQTTVGNMPDIWLYVPGYGSNWLYNDYLMPVDDLIDKSDLSDFNQTMLKYLTRDGKLYGMPFDYNGTGMVYNKQLFERAGVALPTENWTLDELKAAAIEISTKLSAEGGGKIWGYAPHTLGWQTDGYWRGFGATFCNDEGKVSVNNEGGRAMIQWMKDMIDAGAMPLPGDSGGDAVAAFTSGRCAIASGSGSIVVPAGEAEGVKDHLGIARLPVGPSGTSGVGLGGAYVISASCKFPEQAAAFLTHLTSAAVLRETTRGGIPARSSAFDTMTPVLQKFGEAIFDYPPMNALPGIIEVFDIQTANVQEMLTGKKSVDDGLAEIETRGNAALEKAA